MNKPDLHSEPLNSLLKKNIFLVPDGYFEELPATMERKTIFSLYNKSPLQIPHGYFEDLPERISTRIKHTKIVSNLTNASKQPLPDGYFEELPERILEKINQKQKDATPVKSLSPLYRQAIAAGIALACALSIYLFYQLNMKKEALTNKSDTPSHKYANPDHLIASLSKKDIHQYLELKELEEPLLLEHISSVKQNELQIEFEEKIVAEPIRKQDKELLEEELHDIDYTDIEL